MNVNKWVLYKHDLYRIYKAARDVASAAYAAGGASLYTYIDLHGDRTPFKDTLEVYDRTVDPLGHKVQRLATPDGRITHWVEAIQTIGLPLQQEF